MHRATRASEMSQALSHTCLPHLLPFFYLLFIFIYTVCQRVFYLSLFILFISVFFICIYLYYLSACLLQDKETGGAAGAELEVQDKQPLHTQHFFLLASSHVTPVGLLCTNMTRRVVLSWRCRTSSRCLHRVSLIAVPLPYHSFYLFFPHSGQGDWC